MKNEFFLYMVFLFGYVINNNLFYNLLKMKEGKYNIKESFLVYR